MKNKILAIENSLSLTRNLSETKDKIERAGYVQQIEDNDLSHMLAQYGVTYTISLLDKLFSRTEECLNDIYNVLEEKQIKFQHNDLVLYYNRDDHEYFRQGQRTGSDGGIYYAVLFNLANMPGKENFIMSDLFHGGLMHETCHNILKRSLDFIYDDLSFFAERLHRGLQHSCISGLRFDLSVFSELYDFHLLAIQEAVVNWLAGVMTDNEKFSRIFDFQLSEFFQQFQADSRFREANLYILSHYLAIAEHFQIKNPLMAEAHEIIVAEPAVSAFCDHLKEFLKGLKIEINRNFDPFSNMI